MVTLSKTFIKGMFGISQLCTLKEILMLIEVFNLTVFRPKTLSVYEELSLLIGLIANTVKIVDKIH